MAKRYYPSVVFKEEDSCFGITFPDIPGCMSAGNTIDEALSNAEDALDGHIALLQEDGDPIPEASEIWDHAHLRTEEGGENVILIQLVPANVPGKNVKVMISLDDGLLARVDKVAGNYGRSRFFAEAATARLAAEQDQRGSSS